MDLPLSQPETAKANEVGDAAAIDSEEGTDGMRITPILGLPLLMMLAQPTALRSGCHQRAFAAGQSSFSPPLDRSPLSG